MEGGHWDGLGVYWSIYNTGIGVSPPPKGVTGHMGARWRPCQATSSVPIEESHIGERWGGTQVTLGTHWGALSPLGVTGCPQVPLGAVSRLSFVGEGSRGGELRPQGGGGSGQKGFGVAGGGRDTTMYFCTLPGMVAPVMVALGTEGAADTSFTTGL